MNNLIKTTVSLILLTSVLLSASTAYAETIFIDQIFDFTVETDVKYGEGAVGTGSSYIDLELDIYRPTGPELPSLLPGITLIHGGGFTGGNKSHMSAFCEGFARRGWVATSIRYRLSGDNPEGDIYQAYQAAFDDGALAVKWMRDNAVSLNIDSSRLGVGGQSAGAITSLKVGMGNYPGSEVSVVLDISGGLYSTLSDVDENDPSVYMVHGMSDNTVPWDPQATDLAAALEANGVNFVFPQLEGTHSLSTLFDELLPNGNTVIEDYIEFFYDEMDLGQLTEPANLEQFALLSQYWMADCGDVDECIAVDWYVDGTIDTLDLRQLALRWMEGN
jgi:acetyl esterase/lipase